MSAREDDFLSRLRRGQHEGQDLPSEDEVLAYLQASEEPGALSSFGRGAAQGVSFGFADELSAGVKALPRLLPGGESFGDAYSSEVAENRAEDEAARSAHPIATLAGELVGAVAPAIATGGASAPVSGARAGVTAARAGSTIGRLGRQGAALGALEGVGRSEGNILERVPGAVTGAVAGGALGAGLPLVGKGIRRVGEAFGVGQGAAGRRAADEILEALSGEDLAPSDVAGRLTGTADETIMDVAGSTRRLGETANLYPGPGQQRFSEFLEGRAERQFPRVQEAIEGGTGLGRRDTAGLAQEIVESRKAKARPKYQEAYSQGAVEVTPELLDVLQKPSIRAAFERARAIAAEEGVDLGQIGFEEGARSMRPPTVQALDYIKRGLDDLIYNGRRPESGLGPAQLHAIRQTRAQFMDAVENVTGGPDGAYAQARALFAGDTAMLDALDLGRTRFHLDPPAELSQVLDEMTPAEVEMFRRGAVDNVLHRLGNVPDRNDLLKRLVHSPNDVARMGLLFDDQAAYQQFVRTMEAMAEQGVTRNTVLSGSQTASREAGKRALEGEGLGDISLSSLLNEFGGTRRAGAAAETAGELAPMLTETDVPSLIQLLEGRAGERARGAARSDALTRFGALSGSGFLTELLRGGGHESR